MELEKIQSRGEADRSQIAQKDSERDSGLPGRLWAFESEWGGGAVVENHPILRLLSNENNKLS